MFKKVRNIRVNYKQYGEGEDIVLLHGWGQNIEMMDFIGRNLKNSHITIFDLPGFGNASEPGYSMNVTDYADWVKAVLDLMKIKNPILIGHSFGGRVAVKYASKYPTDKVVLLGTPIIRKRKKPNLQERFYKVVKHTPLGEAVKKKIGSDDYNNASNIMREILVKVVNEDLSRNAKKITAPTLLFAGTHDTAVSLEDTYKIAEQMNNAAVIELNGTHYAYLENLNQTCIIINEFINPSKQLKKM
jgi:pimeloyl-ACP methyl ester carboxylesterase